MCQGRSGAIRPGYHVFDILSAHAIASAFRTRLIVFPDAKTRASGSDGTLEKRCVMKKKKKKRREEKKKRSGEKLGARTKCVFRVVVVVTNHTAFRASRPEKNRGPASWKLFAPEVCARVRRFFEPARSRNFAGFRFIDGGEIIENRKNCPCPNSQLVARRDTVKENVFTPLLHRRRSVDKRAGQIARITAAVFGPREEFLLRTLPERRVLTQAVRQSRSRRFTGTGQTQRAGHASSKPRRGDSSRTSKKQKNSRTKTQLRAPPQSAVFLNAFPFSPPCCKIRLKRTEIVVKVPFVPVCLTAKSTCPVFGPGRKRNGYYWSFTTRGPSGIIFSTIGNRSKPERPERSGPPIYRERQ